MSGRASKGGASKTRPWRHFADPHKGRGFLALTVAATVIATLLAGYLSNRPPFLHEGTDSTSKSPSVAGPSAFGGPAAGSQVCGLSGGHSASKGNWGPNRPTFTVQNAQGHAPTLDAITDNPYYGDERHFFDVKSAAVTTAGGWCDQLQVVDSEVLVLRVYVENSAQDPPGDADTEERAAEGSSVKMYEDHTQSSLRTVTAMLTGTNTSPAQVFSTITLAGTSPFRLDLLDHVIVYSNPHPNGYAIGDQAWEGGGALFGPDQANGHMAPGYKYAVFMIATVRVSYVAA